jgi:hypothetical protein
MKYFIDIGTYESGTCFQCNCQSLDEALKKARALARENQRELQQRHGDSEVIQISIPGKIKGTQKIVWDYINQRLG